MLTTTLAIRAVLALLLSTASVAAVLNGPTAKISAHAPVSGATRSDAQGWGATSQSPARRATAYDPGVAYAANDRRNIDSRITPVGFQTDLLRGASDSALLVCR